MKNEFRLHAQARRLLPVLLLALTGMAAFSQIPDTSRYLPQIRLTATAGFGPYVSGTQQPNTILAYDLPAGTTSVTFRFIDADSVQVGGAHTVSGTGIDSVAWNIRPDTMNLPMSPMFHLRLTYNADSTADYYVPYTVYPDTLSFSATHGWGPFITNEYTLTDTTWHPVPQLINTFVVSNLPPRTDTVIFQVMASDTVVIRSYTVAAPQGSWLHAASWPDVRMDNLPLTTTALKAVIKAQGVPATGLAFHKTLQASMQRPRLYSKVGGIHLNDSVARVIGNPTGGQALQVDSTQYAIITNGPGIQMTVAPFNYQGPYSVDIMYGNFSIEGWLRINPDLINHSDNNNMTFMRVDSLFEISINTQSGSPFLQFSSLVGGDLLQLYYIYLDNTVWGHQPEWHHFAFVRGYWQQSFLFYFDGALIGSLVNDANYNYILNTYNYKDFMKTKPLILGGCNAQHTISAGDLSFVTGLDEIRFWNYSLSGDEINQCLHQKILQNSNLTGYWNFDDLRNRLHFISDLSYSNNSGQLSHGAAFIPENPDLYSVTDTLLVRTSNAATDTIRFTFVDNSNSAVDSVKLKVQNHAAQLAMDLSDLPYTVTMLRVQETGPGIPATDAITEYPLQIIPSPPVATPQSNWGNYYYSANGYGTLTNPILVNGIPGEASRVVLGIAKNDTLYNTDTITQNTVPYQYSLHLNGIDNYIQTSQYLMSPNNFELSLWFRTTTTQGGKLIGFCDTQSGITNGTHDRELLMETDGSLRFVYLNNNSSVTLYGSNKYNDGAWHCVTIWVNPPADVTMYVDNSLVAFGDQTALVPYYGYWVIGHNGPTDVSGPDAIASYFNGDLAYINILTQSDRSDLTPDPALVNGAHRGGLLFKLDEGSGTTVHDSEGSNTGTVKGTSPRWYSTNKISMLRWQCNMLAYHPGTYTFFAKVFYPGTGATGITYPLGTFTILDPLPGKFFAYNLAYGNGYFNEGTLIPNLFNFETSYTGHGEAGWTNNFLRYYVMSPDHQVIDQNSITWTQSGYQGSITIDMGDAIPGSYLALQIGYQSTGNVFHVAGTMTIPILVRPMLAPTVTGNFGPFEQAIAPGTMEALNTFTLSEPNLTDLTKVVATFYDQTGNPIAEANGVKVNDTTWQVTQNMALLSPPGTDMKIAYYLGTNEFLALVAGPYRITIHRTRPGWFDIISDTCFHNIQQRGDSVTFLVDTPFDNSNVIDNASEMDIPSWVPLLGGSSCSMSTPAGQANLKYKIPQSKLFLNGPPEFFQKYFQLGEGDPHSLAINFNYSQNNTYSLDAYNNLLAEQNFVMGGSITSRFEKELTVAQRIKNIIQLAGAVDPATIIVSPTFEIQASGSFQYSSRLNLRIDTLTGNWGSFGNLDVDANPAHGAAYTNSASYHFYGGSLGLEFSVGAQVLEGLLAGYFGLQGVFDLGFGHSYITIPSPQKKPLKSFEFQTYGRFYIDILWDWYERNIWGPKLFYSSTLWGDDMTNAFPPNRHETRSGSLKAASSPSGLVTEISPVSSFSQIPLPRPQTSVTGSDDCLMISWLEPGAVSGERQLRCQYLNSSGHHFSDLLTIETNHSAMNSPAVHLSGDSLAMIAWAQSRCNQSDFYNMNSQEPMSDFLRSQDIWFSVFNLHKNSVVQTGRLTDDTVTLISGRAEANPKIILLSPSRSLVAWQVIQEDLKAANIWYTILEKGAAGWNQVAPPSPVTSDTDIKTRLKIAATPGGGGVLAWLNTARDGDQHSTVRSRHFDGLNWTSPVTVSSGDAIRCNYIDLEINGQSGGLVYTHFIEDTLHGHHEELVLVPWDAGHWNTGSAMVLLTDSTCHLQIPSLALHGTSTAAVAVKREVLNLKSPETRVSQTDLFKGELGSAAGSWKHVAASPYLCDTTRQVSELNLGFISHDTLMLLSQENELFASNTASVPRNGRVFNDPYMDQVLRCFAFRDDGRMDDVDENPYFAGISFPQSHPATASGMRCFPNPCSDYTTICFHVGKAGPTKMELWNISGIRVATLFSRQLTAGYYEIGVHTATLQPGTYICRLRGIQDDVLKLVVNH